jgi:hypothetical protein
LLVVVFQQREKVLDGVAAKCERKRDWSVFWEEIVNSAAQRCFSIVKISSAAQRCFSIVKACLFEEKSASPVL